MSHRIRFLAWPSSPCSRPGHRASRPPSRAAPRGYSIPLIDLARRGASAGRRGPGGGPVPRAPDDGPARGRQDDPRRLPEGARPRGHRPEAEHRRRAHLVRSPPHARELGHLEGDAHDPPGRRPPGQEAADPVLGPVPDPHVRQRGRRPDLVAAGADRRLRRDRGHGQRRTAQERRLHGPVPRRRPIPARRGRRPPSSGSTRRSRRTAD